MWGCDLHRQGAGAPIYLDLGYVGRAEGVVWERLEAWVASWAPGVGLMALFAGCLVCMTLMVLGMWVVRADGVGVSVVGGGAGGGAGEVCAEEVMPVCGEGYQVHVVDGYGREVQRFCSDGVFVVETMREGGVWWVPCGAMDFSH